VKSCCTSEQINCFVRICVWQPPFVIVVRVFFRYVVLKSTRFQLSIPPPTLRSRFINEYACICVKVGVAQCTTHTLVLRWNVADERMARLSARLCCALLTLLVYFGAKTVAAQSGNCRRPVAADLGSTAAASNEGLLVLALTSSAQGSNIRVQLTDYQIVCLALGSMRDRYRMTSVIASYTTSAIDTPMTGQFHFQCGNGAWTVDVLNNPGFSTSSTPLVGSLTTPERSDCRLCTDRVEDFTPAEHCVGKYIKNSKIINLHFNTSMGIHALNIIYTIIVKLYRPIHEPIHNEWEHKNVSLLVQS